MKPKELTEKEKLFVHYYNINGNNAAAASKAAGYESKNHRINGFEVRNREHVKDALIKTKQTLKDLAMVSDADVMDVLTAIMLKHEDKNPMLTMQAVDKIMKINGIGVERLDIKQEIETKHTFDIDEAEELLREHGVDVDKL